MGEGLALETASMGPSCNSIRMGAGSGVSPLPVPAGMAKNQTPLDLDDDMMDDVVMLANMQRGEYLDVQANAATAVAGLTTDRELLHHIAKYQNFSGSSLFCCRCLPHHAPHLLSTRNVPLCLSLAFCLASSALYGGDSCCCATANLLEQLCRDRAYGAAKDLAAASARLLIETQHRPARRQAAVVVANLSTKPKLRTALLASDQAAFRDPYTQQRGLVFSLVCFSMGVSVDSLVAVPPGKKEEEIGMRRA